ncbi:MAG: hypothetical protein HUJ53_08635, partial [Holdemanella sp.]|nr:hypothetical protein [Holdemanella sp.]
PTRYVLHRIIEVREKDYVILGDNCITKEYGITDKDIVGVAISFKRKGKDLSIDNPFYKLYSRIWVNSYPVRMFWRKSIIRRGLSFIKRKVYRKENT